MHKLMMFFPSKVLDGLLAQCGTVENCEQGEALKKKKGFKTLASIEIQIFDQLTFGFEK